MGPTTLYLADWVIPITRPPFSRGGIAVSGSTIVGVDHERRLKARFPDAEVRDFGPSALLPGLVNVHSHLELTVMRGLLEERAFFRWLLRLTKVRAQLSAEDLLDSARAGVCEAIRSGQTTMADVGATPAGFTALCESGLRAVAFQEVIAFRPADAQSKRDELARTVERLQAHPARSDRVIVGISPHAPYTVTADLFRLVSAFARDRNMPLCIHAAESLAEEEFVRRGRGEFALLYRSRLIRWKPPRCSPIAYLHSLGVLQARPLLIHCVRVDEQDVREIAESGSTIAHCPTSNAKLGHGVAPLPLFVAAGIAVGLGTDSVASNNFCDLLGEARFCLLLHRAMATGDEHRRFSSWLTPANILQLATLGGARALSLDHRIGSLDVGKEADFIVINLAHLHAQPVYDPVTAIVLSCRAEDVIFTAVAGQVLYDGDAVRTLDEIRIAARIRSISERIAQRGEGR
jgi:5-methylthioadenosine/S-adenosylhomocysteine deaminase